MLRFLYFFFTIALTLQKSRRLAELPGQDDGGRKAKMLFRKSSIYILSVAYAIDQRCESHGKEGS